MYRVLFPCEFIQIGILVTFIFFKMQNLRFNARLRNIKNIISIYELTSNTGGSLNENLNLKIRMSVKDLKIILTPF